MCRTQDRTRYQTDRLVRRQFRSQNSAAGEDYRMSDARWFDVEEDVKSAVGHFSKSVRIFELGGFDGSDLPAYIARMALMQSMQAGYTSLESAFERILEMIGEEKPAGANYHADLLRRVSRDIPDSRPAIIGG